MPIDPSISLKTTPIVLPDFAAGYSNVIKMRDLMTEGKIRKMQLSEAMQEQQEREQVKAILQREPDPQKAIQEIMRVSPKAGALLSKAFADSQKSGLDTEHQKLINDGIKAEGLARLFDPSIVVDQASHQAATASAVQSGLLTPEQAQNPVFSQYTPDNVQRVWRGSKAAEEAAKQALEERKAATSAQEGMERTYAANRTARARANPPAPQRAQVPGVDVPFSPEVLAQKEALAQKTSPQIPGRDIPLPAPVEAQRARMAANRPPAMGSASPQDVKDTARAIVEGQATPVLTNYSFRDRTALAGELSRAGYNQMEAERDYKAVNKHLTTLNGAQQLRLRQAVSFAYDHLEVVDNLYRQWAAKAKASGFKVVNKAALAASAQLPGEMGALAQNLQAQINDFTSEMGTVYKGGNASTDETLRLAAGNLKADWNEQTWNMAVTKLKQSLTIRRNSINTTEAVGVTPGSPYMPPVPEKEPLPGETTTAEPTAINPKTGQRLVLRGGKWVPQ
jgi:hypothetical protein